MVNPPLIAVVPLLYLSGFMCIWLSHIRLNVGHVLSWYITLHYLVGLSGLEQTMTAKNTALLTHGILIRKDDSRFKILSLLCLYFILIFNRRHALISSSFDLILSVGITDLGSLNETLIVQWESHLGCPGLYIFLSHNIKSHNVEVQLIETIGGFSNKIKNEIRYLMISGYHNFIT